MLGKILLKRDRDFSCKGASVPPGKLADLVDQIAGDAQAKDRLLVAIRRGRGLSSIRRVYPLLTHA